MLPTLSSDKSCETCQFWKAGSESGECRRSAPLPMAHSKGSYANWLVTRKDDWCGEYVQDGQVVLQKMKAAETLRFVSAQSPEDRDFANEEIAEMTRRTAIDGKFNQMQDEMMELTGHPITQIHANGVTLDVWHLTDDQLEELTRPAAIETK